MSPITKDLEAKFADAADKETPAELINLFECFSIETTSNCIFGIEAGTFNRGKQTEDQIEYCKNVFNFFIISFVDMLKMSLLLVPFLRAVIGMLKVPLNKPSETKYVLNMLSNRRQAGIERNDLANFMAMALEKKQKEIGDKVSETLVYQCTRICMGWPSCITAKSFFPKNTLQSLKDVTGWDLEDCFKTNVLALFLASHDTTSLFIAYVFYEITLNMDVQRKLQAEIDEAFDVEESNDNDGMLEYGTLLSLQYMDKVIKETLRKYPPAPVIPRTCTKDYTLPDNGPTIPKANFPF